VFTGMEPGVACGDVPVVATGTTPGGVTEGGEFPGALLGIEGGDAGDCASKTRVAKVPGAISTELIVTRIAVLVIGCLHPGAI
jgi:hypothetical protein